MQGFCKQCNKRVPVESKGSSDFFLLWFLGLFGWALARGIQGYACPECKGQVQPVRFWK